jgi:ATP-dependent DNA helicase RecQ
LAKYLPAEFIQKPVIDTLWLSSLIFIRKPYHKLIKEYKKPIDPEYEDELDSFFMRHIPDSDYDNSLAENDPIKDAGYSLKVFENCVEEFRNIPDSSQQILYSLLYNKKQFYAFFQYLEENKLFKDKDIDLEREVRKILEPTVLRKEFFNEEFIKILELEPLSFAYIFRLIEQNLNRDLSVTPDCSILPFWILHKLENINKVFAKIFKYKKFDAKTELRSW